jgi:hypothetical protein
MTLRAARAAFSLDPLMAEAKRRARRRRVLIALGILAVAGLAAGLTFAFRSPGGGSPSGGGLASASYSQWGVSLRYPAAWTRLDCTTWPAGDLVNPISLLTTASPAPTCPRARTMEFPPPERLAADGAVVFLGHGFALQFKPNASIDGQPALIRPRTVGSAMYVGAHSLTAVSCPAGVRREYRAAYIKRPGHHPNDMFTVAALICGPHFGTGDAAMSNLLASMRFADASK